jgi:hypothetical protein
MDEEDPFESAKLLLEEAEHNIAELREMTMGYLSDPANSETFVRPGYPTANEKTIGMRLVAPPPRRVRPLASGAIKHLRDSLDQACFASAMALGAMKPHYTYFPFASDPDDFWTLFDPKQRCRDIPKEVRDFLFSLQPFPSGSGHKGGNDLLREFGSISGPNKHQLALKLVPVAGGAHIEKFSGSGGSGRVVANWLPLKREIHVLYVSSDAQIGELSFAIPVDFHLDGATAISRPPASAVLGELLAIAKGVVFGLEAETGRILRERG